MYLLSVNVVFKNTNYFYVSTCMTILLCQNNLLCSHYEHVDVNVKFLLK